MGLLEKDISETDRFGRLLRYVYLEDGRMVNELLVAEGFAQVSTFPPDVKYVDRFLEAQAAERGLWSQCDGDEGSGVEVSEVGDCDTAYPEVCISPPPPDLDCGEVVYRRFKVLAPDPHGFGGDGDGVGCES